MARGYKSNGNLFGTDYDPGDDEEEKARLAAESAMMGAGGMTFMNTSPRGPTRKYAGAPASQSTSTYPPLLKSELLNILENADAREAQGLPRQSASGVIDPPLGVAELQSAQSITPPVERPTAVAQEQPEAVVSSFLQAPDTPSDLGGPLLRGFDMAGGFKKDMADLRPVDPQTGEFLTGTVIAAGEQAGLTFPSQVSLPKPHAPEAYTAPMGQDATRAALGGMTLNEYLNAPAGTEGVSGLRTDPQGRMIPSSNTVGGPATRAEAFPGYESEVAKAQARLSERDIRQGETQAQRDTRIQRDQSIVSGQTGGQLSQADLRDLAQASMGDATEGQVARGLQIQQRAGLGQFEPDSTGGLTFEQKLAQDKFEFDVNKFNFDQSREASDEATANARSSTAAKFAVRDQLRQGANVMDKAQRAGKNIGFFTTGATGALFGLVAGTGAYDQKATVETLEADAAFSALRRMRDASKTGGALGNVSERELDLLKATAGSLRVGQSEEQFRANLGQYVERYNESMLNIYDAFVADYGEKDANEAFKVNGRQDLIPQQGDNQSTSGGTTTETASGRYSVTVL